MKNKSKTHEHCEVCKEWKHNSEMTVLTVCTQCFETHDKYGQPREGTNEKV